MATVTFTQRSTPDGQIALHLNSADLPSGSFSFSITFNYSGQSVKFSDFSVAGGAATQTSASYAGSSGTVTISGTLAPSSGAPFATLLFDALGKGSFDANIQTLRINGSTPVFTDPVAYDFSILGETAVLAAGGSASGVYKPIDAFFGGVTYAVKAAPQNGTIVFGQTGNPSAWKYTPATDFYGVDSFTLKVSDGFDTKEKTILATISPVGTAKNDTFHSSAGNYKTDGGSGIDTLKYAGKMVNFTVAKSGATSVVTDKSGVEGVNTLDNFERLMFSDGAIALDISGNGGQAYRLYQAAFNRVPDAGGVGFWMSMLDKGMSLTSVATGFMDSAEFKAVYGAAPSNTQLVSKFYENILHRQPEKAGLDYWVGVLDARNASTAEVLAAISESAENQAALVDIIGNGFVYTPYGG